MVGCVLVLGIVVIYKWQAPSVASGSCKATGFVYNADQTPAVGLQAVKLSYVPSGLTNAPAVQVATTSPDGHFSFDCSRIPPEAFPIHLRADHTGQLIESEDALLFADNAEVNLYFPLRAVSNHYRLNQSIVRVSSAQLLRSNYVPLTNNANPVRPATNLVVTVPKNARISKETISRLRLSQ